jgi:Predicted transcriptional regulator
MKAKNHIENEYAAGCARVSGGCVAYHGALQYYALQTQQFNTIYLHSDKRFRPFVIDGVAYEYHPLKFTYNIVISKDPDGNPIAVTSLSQTIVDCIRHIDLAGGLEELLYALSSISYGRLNEKDMLVCLEAYDNASLWSRTGYLLPFFKAALVWTTSF